MVQSVKDWFNVVNRSLQLPKILHQSTSRQGCPQMLDIIQVQTMKETTVQCQQEQSVPFHHQSKPPKQQYPHSGLSWRHGTSRISPLPTPLTRRQNFSHNTLNWARLRCSSGWVTAGTKMATLKLQWAGGGRANTTDTSLMCQEEGRTKIFHCDHISLPWCYVHIWNLEITLYWIRVL